MIDLGAAYDVSAVWYVARQDGGWNGTIADVQVSVGDDPDDWGDLKPVKVQLKKTRQAQAIKLPETRGRYVRIEALSEVNGGPWASAAEIAVEGTKPNE